MISASLFPANYNNPFWETHYFDFIRINNRSFKPNSIKVDTSVSFDTARGIYTGFFYEFGSGINFSKYLGFSNKIRLGENIPKIRIAELDSEFMPFSFLKLFIDYKYRDFYKYRIGEHNLIANSEIIINPIKYFSISFFHGADFRFVDLNIYDNKSAYGQDWISSIFFLWKIQIMVHPAFVYSVGFSLGNTDDFEIFSLNYWQFELVNYFHLPKNFSIFANGGFAYAGSLPFAGIINRFWFRIGLRYEIKIH
jgi:hypothetical protein